MEQSRAKDAPYKEVQRRPLPKELKELSD